MPDDVGGMQKKREVVCCGGETGMEDEDCGKGGMRREREIGKDMVLPIWEIGWQERRETNGGGNVGRRRLGRKWMFTAFFTVDWKTTVKIVV